MISSSLRQLSLHEWASVQTELIWVYDQVVAPHFRHRNEIAGRTGYWARYVRAGRVVVTGEDGRRVEAGTGQWLTGSRGKGRVDITDDAHILSIHFLCQWPNGENLFGREIEARMIEDRDCPMLRRRCEVLERAVRKWHPSAQVGYAHETSTYQSFLKHQALFVNWLMNWCEAMTARGCIPAYGGGDDDRLTRVVRRLNEAPLAKGFPRDALKTEARLSGGHLDLRFQQSFGLSPWRYWERRKLEHAKHRLLQENVRVKQIAYELGFKSDAHFVSWFRRLTGETPGGFRSLPSRAI